MHALIIEDEWLIALAIEVALRDLGFTSFAFATTQEEAIAAARDRCPDLITADLHLLSGSGLAAVQAICRDCPLPVVFITGNPERLAGLPTPVLAKPFQSESLTQAMAQAQAQPYRHGVERA